MRHFLMVSLLFILAIAPSGISAQTSVSGINVGPHGNDFFIGTWTCRNSIPSAGFPALVKTTATRSASSPSDIFIRSSAQGYDASGFLHYDAKTQTWWGPTTVSSGDTISESTRQTGKTTVWNGTMTGASGTVKIRDTFVQPDMRSYSDTTEIQSTGAWKTVTKATCTKS